jgi:WhiB family redox-sensing transcriptional regulator
VRIEPTAMIDAEFERLCDTLADVVAERRQEWRQFAACRGVDPATFFPERGDRETVEAAKSLCATCPVAEECIEYAVSLGTRSGIWGGRSAHNYRSSLTPKTCELCKCEFRTSVPQRRLCSEECRTEARRRTIRDAHLRKAS